jgi:hypothetical protein
MTEAKKRQRVPLLHLRLGAPELKNFKEFILDEVREKRERRNPVVWSYRLPVEFLQTSALGPADSADLICISGFWGGEGSPVQCGVRRTKYKGPQDNPEGVQWGRWGGRP